MIKTHPIASVLALVIAPTAFTNPIDVREVPRSDQVGHSIISSPLKPAPTRQASPAGLLRTEAMPLQVDPSAFVQIRSRSKQGRVRIDDWPLPDGRFIALDLQPVEVLAPTAEFVLMSRDPDGIVRPRAVQAPSATLWAGRIAGQPDSRVFMGLAETGCNGFISGAEGDFMIASPPAQPGPPAIFRVGSDVGSIPMNLDGFSCHIDELLGQEHGPQLADDPFGGLIPAFPEGGLSAGGGAGGVQHHWPEYRLIGVLIGGISATFLRRVN